MSSDRTAAKVVGVGFALALAVTAIIALFVFVTAEEDPGIVACQSIRDNTESSGSTEGLTEQEYQETRELLSQSNHDKIRTHGLKLLDLSWQLQDLDEDAGFEALPLLESFMDTYIDFSGACASQGVVIPKLEWEDA